MRPPWPRPFRQFRKRQQQPHQQPLQLWVRNQQSLPQPSHRPTPKRLLPHRFLPPKRHNHTICWTAASVTPDPPVAETPTVSGHGIASSHGTTHGASSAYAGSFTTTTATTTTVFGAYECVAVTGPTHELSLGNQQSSQHQQVAQPQDGDSSDGGQAMRQAQHAQAMQQHQPHNIYNNRCKCIMACRLPLELVMANRWRCTHSSRHNGTPWEVLVYSAERIVYAIATCCSADCSFSGRR